MQVLAWMGPKVLRKRGAEIDHSRLDVVQGLWHNGTAVGED